MMNGAQRWNDWNGHLTQAEGAVRLGPKEYRQFVGIARGSAGKVCYQLLSREIYTRLCPALSECDK